MPRKKKVAEKKPKVTYHKSKNGRYYKKSQNSAGKTITRFCCAAEAVSNGGGSVGSGSGTSIPKKRQRVKKKQAKEE